MPKKVSSALIGPGVGPFVRLGGMGLLRITGLPAGESVRLLQRKAAEVVERVLSENGRHEVEESDYIQVVYDGQARGFCALLES